MSEIQTVRLLGYPLGHSISPSFQQAAFDYCGLNVRYSLCEVESPKLAEVVGKLRLPSSLGANVTVPHKEAVIPFIDELDGLASRIGAVNTIVHRDNKLVGYNTDASGFLRALRSDGHFEPKDKVAVVLGAGGVSRAVSFALIDAGVKSLALIEQDIRRAELLALALASLGVKVRTASSDGNLSGILQDCDLLVNCTPVGMKSSSSEGRSPIDIKLIPAGALVYDVVYIPSETRLMQDARSVGADILGGLTMLVYQGAAAFELWTGRNAPDDVMFKAAREALEG
ncbi:MAG: shikimate dehydrogenase [Dehalococcoidia bacterium]|nr:shikimate dehydrogenase [Dehalococcoidia bacterium]